MSVISTAPNYGGRVVDNQQGVKQFYISQNGEAAWIYKQTLHHQNISVGKTITPASSKYPVLIDNDLIVTGSIYNTSDSRLKHEIDYITPDKIDKCFQLNPIEFKFKNDVRNRQNYGFLAQEIERDFPELVSENTSGFKTVNYQGMIALMFAKIQQMQLEINDLKNKINGLA